MPLSNTATYLGVTYTFAQDYNVGYTCFGRPWAENGGANVVVTAISPEPTEGRNGHMLDPDIGRLNGFDDRLSASHPYSHALNVGAALPLSIPAGSSLVGAVSTEAAVAFGQIDRWTMLHVLAAEPPAGVFAPAPIGGDYSVFLRESDLDYDALPRLPRSALAPLDIAESAAEFSRPWYEQDLLWTGRYMHALYQGNGNYSNGGYGRNMALKTGTAGLQLMIDWSDAQKRDLLVGLVQYGIDIYGLLQAGGSWHADGGHNVGRLIPLMVAAQALHHEGMRTLLAGELMRFQEYQQTFYVAQSDIDLPRPGRTPYIQAELGKPEWGIRHYSNPGTDDNNWSANYRTSAGSTMQATAMVAKLLGLLPIIGYDSFYEYAQRHIHYRLGRFADPAYYNGYDDGDDYGEGNADSAAPFASQDIPDWHMEFWAAFEGADPVAPAEFDLSAPAGSLRFPENNHETADPNFKGLLLQPASGFPTLLGGDGALFLKLRLPLYRMWTNRSYRIAGTGGTSANSWSVYYSAEPHWQTARRGRFTAYLRGNTGDTIDINSALVDEEDILLVFRRSGNAFALDWVSLADGSYHAGAETTATSSGANAAQWGLGYATGAADLGIVNEPVGAFSGEISQIGYAAKAVATGEWQDIALGADPKTEIGEEDLTYYRELRGTDATSLSAASSGDGAGPLVVAAGSEALQPGSTLGRQAPAAWLAIDRMPDGYVHAVRADVDSRQVAFSGTAGGSNGSTVQVRLVYESGAIHRDWTDVGAVADGAWSGSIAVGRCSGGWIFAQARLAQTPSLVADHRSRFAVGYKVGLMGQSQVGILVRTRGGDEALDRPERYSFSAWQWITNWDQPRQLLRLAGMKGPDGIIMAANQLDAYAGRDGTPVCFVSLARHGASARSLIDDSNTYFQWSELAAVNDFVGSDYTCLLWQWGTADVGYASSYGNVLDAAIHGIGPLAADHHVYDGSIFSNEPPVILSPFSRQATTSTGPHDFDQGPSFGTMRTNQFQWFRDRDLTIGPSVSDVRVDPQGGPHQTGDGNLLMGQRFGTTVARYLGLDTSANPKVAAAQFGSEARAEIVLTFDLPNGGALKTGGAEQVRGLEISSDHGSTWSRSGFAATVEGQTVRIAKDSGSWPALGTQARYMLGGPLSYGNAITDDELLPGVLYESSAADITGLGLPIDGTESPVLVGGIYDPEEPPPPPPEPTGIEGTGRGALARKLIGGMRK